MECSSIVNASNVLCTRVIWSIVFSQCFLGRHAFLASRTGPYKELLYSDSKAVWQVKEVLAGVRKCDSFFSRCDNKKLLQNKYFTVSS